MAEPIREAALEGVRDELPPSLAVVIDEVTPRPDNDDLVDVHAILYAERDSQKRCDRQRRCPAARSRHRCAHADRESCWGQQSTSTWVSRSPRTGSATQNSLAGLGF